MNYEDITAKYGNDVKKAWDSNRNTHTTLYKSVILPYSLAKHLYVDEDYSLSSIINYIKETYSITVTEKSLGKLINTVYDIHKLNPRQSSAKHSRENSLANTGYEHYRRDPEWKRKYVEDNIRKYGVPSYLQTIDGKEKSRETLIKNYNVTSPLKNKSILEKAQHSRNKSITRSFQFNPNDYVSHIEESIDILKSVPALSTIFKDKVTYSDIERVLGVPYSTIQNYRKYIWEANILKPNSSSTSYEEKELLEFICTVYKGTILENVKILDGKEIDIYMPDLSIGIEFNGDYWHSDNRVDSNYHDNKSQLASKLGINLVNVWEDEWRDTSKREIVKSIIKYKLGISKRVYARKTTVKPISNSESVRFYEENHIQGGSGVSGISYGLIKDGVIVAAMTFCKSRYDSSYEYELLRFSNKIGYTVVGGASKLLSYFESNNKPKSIMSYSNRNFSKTGESSLYRVLGFNYVKHTKPMYIWVNSYTCDRLSRYQTQVSKLKKFSDFRDINPNETEREYMKKKGYVKVTMVGNDLYAKEYK